MYKSQQTVQLKVVASDLNADPLKNSSLGNLQKVFRSAFVICQSSSGGAGYILVVKPKSIFLKDDSSTLKDMFGNSGNNIAGYAPYEVGEILQCRYLSPYKTVKNILVDDYALVSDISAISNGSLEESVQVSVGGSSISFKYAFCEDINLNNRSRLASPTTDVTFEGYSKWL